MTTLNLTDAANARMHEDPTEWIFQTDEGIVDTLAGWLHANTAPDVTPFSVGEVFTLCTLSVGEMMYTPGGYLRRIQ